MTRQDFIANTWRPYPQVPGRIQGPSLWVWGRVFEISDQGIRLDQGYSEFPYYRQAAEDADEYLGSPMPWALMVKGDIVALKLDKNQTATAGYLLSPCLQSHKQEIRKDWQYFLQAVKDHFHKKDFRYWQTPNLVSTPGVDAHIDFMKVTGVRTKQSWYLPTSPEIELKKIIASGERRIFEVKPVYRDDDQSAHHRSEFTMLEWYRAYQEKWSLLKDISDLVSSFEGQQPLDIQKVPMASLFEKYVGINLTPQTNKEELLTCIKKHQLDYDSTDDWDDLFNRLFIHFVEPNLKAEGAIAIYNYPASQSSIARLTEDGWSDRFEFYWQGVEIANAYQEQNDASLVDEKIKQEIEKRKALGRESFPVDGEFISMMKAGFPPCCGAALGLERLFMVLTGQNSI